MEEQQRKQQSLETQIEETHNSIHQVSAALGKNPPDLSVFSDAPLKVLLRNYQVQLAKLHEEKESVIRDLNKEWTKLHQLWDELGTPRNPQDFNADINEFDPSSEFAQIDEVSCFNCALLDFFVSSPPPVKTRTQHSSPLQIASSTLDCRT